MGKQILVIDECDSCRALECDFCRALTKVTSGIRHGRAHTTGASQ
jgi:hypothetical protein